MRGDGNNSTSKGMLFGMKHVEVVAACMVKDGKVFIAQRHLGGEAGGKWEFPGGKIEPGETPKDALKREIKEELKADIEVGDLLVAVRHAYATVDITLQVYQCKLLGNDPVLTEHLSSLWVGWDELCGVDWAPADKEVVEKLSNPCCS